MPIPPPARTSRQDSPRRGRHSNFSNGSAGMYSSGCAMVLVSLHHRDADALGSAIQGEDSHYTHSFATNAGKFNANV